MGYAFISYSSRNTDDAVTLRSYLTKRGVDTWMAPGDIPAGSNYAGVITKAIKGAECLVLLLTDESQNSTWVDKEVERALSYRKTVIPIAMDDLVLNDSFEFYLSNQQIIPVRQINEDNKELQKIVDQVIKLVGNSLDETKEPASAKNDYVTVSREFKDYLIKAQEGDANAQYQLGSIYSTGRDGIVKDYEKAYFWYMKAAESGHAIAMYYLAWMYKRGDGIKEDPEKAFYWFEKAAEKGNVYAICNVGDCYKKGYYVKRDYVKAAEWYKKGEHSSICCLALGELYELGNGVEKDLEKAMHYYETAEILGGVGDSPKKAMERVERKIRHMKTW